MTTQGELFKRFLKKKEQEDKPEISKGERVEAMNKRMILDKVKDKRKYEKKFGSLSNKEYEQIKEYERINKEHRRENKLNKVRYATRSYKYDKSRSGKISSATTRFFKYASGNRPVTSYLYSRNKPVSMADHYKATKIRQIQQQQVAQQLQQNRESSFYDYVFRAGDLVTPQLERELSFNGSNSVASAGDRTARFDMELDINATAHILDGNIFNPLRDVSREVNIFSNLLS